MIRKLRPIDDSDLIPLDGNPNRRTLKERPHGSRIAAPERPERSTSTSGKKEAAPAPQRKRVQVTPSDWEELQLIAERLALPYSKVYNIAFQYLKRELGAADRRPQAAGSTLRPNWPAQRSAPRPLEAARRPLDEFWAGS